MKARVGLVIIQLLLCSNAFGDASAAPAVIFSTVTQNGVDAVDEPLDSVHVTFSDMIMDDSWAWVRSDENTFPALVGSPSYELGNYTAVLPVQLEPDTYDAISINIGDSLNFCDGSEASTLPYLIKFKTGLGT